MAPIVDKSSDGSEDRYTRTAFVKGLVSILVSAPVGIILGVP